MKLTKITEWLDKTLCVSAFDDVSNNGLQLAREGGEVRRAAVAVDASLRAVEAAAVKLRPRLVLGNILIPSVIPYIGIFSVLFTPFKVANY